MSAWTCNISWKGRIIRFLLGLIFLAAGIFLIVAKDSAFWGMGLCAFGAFGMFEGLKGWCAMRALGVKTPF